MDEVPEARTLPEDTIAAMVAAVTPAREVVTTRRNDRGFCSVYRVVVAGEGDRRTLYLKASPDGQPWGIPTEARLQAVIDATTSLPVPAVVGAVDDHDTLPTPFYLMEALPGEELAYERIGRLEDGVLEGIARDIGRYLGELHALPAVEQFGHVRHGGPELSGGEPSGDPDTLTVGNPYDAWEDALRSYAEAELDRHAESCFSALTPTLRRWVEAGIERLDGPFEPVLGRNDHGLHNLLVDPAGEVTAMLDWGYTLAVPDAFDFEFAVYLFSGAFLAGLADVPDRRPLVREAMVAGYRTAAPDRAGTVSSPDPLYEALAMIRIMNDFEHLAIPDGTEGAVMDRIEADVREVLAEDR